MLLNISNKAHWENAQWSKNNFKEGGLRVQFFFTNSKSLVVTGDGQYYHLQWKNLNVQGLDNCVHTQQE